jgi:hypothetical protein
VSALLVYRINTAEAMAWAEDIKVRTIATREARADWMDKLYNAHEVPDDDSVRGAFVQGKQFSGISWPKGTDLPRGWYRPVKSPELIRPKGGSKASKDLRRFDLPDMRRELNERFGMNPVVFHGLGMYSPGVRLEDDGVWVIWGSKDFADQLHDVEAHGWVRVPLTEYIERFGEDAL